jgi:hypothetical protein
MDFMSFLRIKRKHTVRTGFVYAGDVFLIDVDAKTVQHKRHSRHAQPFGEVVGAYAFAVDASGTIVAMVHADKKALRAAAAKKTTAWLDPYPQICARNYIVTLLQEKMEEQGIPQ